MADRSVRVRLEAITTNFNRKLSESAVLTKQFSRELEAADGRMANMVQGALALAPALVPIGAAGIPAVAGLTAQLGFATLGVGALVLGLRGVGDAFDALNTYQLDPTEAHFKKLQQTMEKLGPAGGEFVLFLDHVQPRLQRLQHLAEAGLLPGLEDSIRNALHLMPQLRNIVFTTSTTLGDLVREAGNNLDDPRWQEFFGFLETRARPTLTEMGQTAGNFTEAFTNLVMTFDPLERDFSQGLLHMSQTVRDWSDGLGQTKGFQDLISYIQTNGPKALDTLGAAADALVQIVEAGAPVGSVVLPALTEVLHVVGAIADTPAGPVIIGIAAAVGTLGRSMALLKAVGLRGEGDNWIGRALGVKEIKGVPASYREVAAATDKLRVAQEAAAAAAVRGRDAQFSLVPDAKKHAAVTEFAAAQDKVREAEDKLTAARQKRSDALKQTAVTAGKATALVAGLAVSESGLAEKTGLADTASLALMGTMAGPWGAAIGGAAGFAMDLAHANDDVTAALKRVETASKGIDFAEQRAAMDDLIAKNEKYQQIPNPFTHPLAGLKSGAQGVGQLFGIDPQGDAQKKTDEAVKQMGELRTNALSLYRVINGVDPSTTLSVSDSSLTAFLTKISPALQRAGIDIGQLLSSGKSGWLDAQVAVHDWVVEMDSAQGRSQAVADALAQLGDQITPTVDAAKALSDALDALFGPQLNQSEALDRWISGLQDLRTELGKNKGSLEGNSDAALKNRDAIRGSVEDLLNRAKADAAAGVDGDKIAHEILKGRDAIVETAVAAGQNRGEVERYLRSLGLTGKNLATILDRLPGKVDRISAAMRKLRDKTVTVKIRQVMDAQANAEGGIHYYSQGDVANRHMPELAGPGVTRIWREPETRGEAYIPLANDFRRPRAIDIWERTGQALGVSFRRYALGGGTGLPGGGGELRLAQGDIDRIVRGLATVRPIAGVMNVQPHNYDEFLRQKEHIERQAGVGGPPP